MADRQIDAPAPWWASGAVYQVYVRSFADGDGDGIGDLSGLRSRLDYLAELGVDALWLNPCYPSPQHDHGYDVADFFGIEPDYGDLDEFDALITDARARGIRVLMDVVPNHCSVEHAWFRAAIAAGPGSVERQRFYFRDGRGVDGGEPPNNWTSIFSGPAWSRVVEPDGSPGQWYLHVFAPEQPDLNAHHPDVAEMFDDMLLFWLRRGVAGFRCDAVTVVGKAPGLPDLPGELADQADQLGFLNPLFNHRPEGLGVWKRWRALVEKFAMTEGGGVAPLLIAEAACPDPDLLARYVNAEGFHQTFAFDLLRADWTAASIRDAVTLSTSALATGGGWPAWTINNHDAQRAATRWGRADAHLPSTRTAMQYSVAAVDLARGRRRAAAMAAFMLALPGSVYLYAGEELGLPEVLDLPDEARQDPVFRRTGGREPGRDGCRVPLPWLTTSACNWGFSAAPGAAAWMWQPPDWGRWAVERQGDDETSVLHMYRRFLAVRRQRPEIADSACRIVTTTDPLVVIERGSLLAVLNPSDTDVELPAALLGGRRPIVGSDLPSDRRGTSVLADSCVWFA